MPFEIMGENLRNYRKKQNYTQEQLAEKAEISAVFLSQIENGKKIPSLETLAKITKILDISMEQVFSERQTKQTNIDKRFMQLLQKRSDTEKLFIFDIAENILSKISNEKITL